MTKQKYTVSMIALAACLLVASVTQAEVTAEAHLEAAAGGAKASTSANVQKAIREQIEKNGYKKATSTLQGRKSTSTREENADIRNERQADRKASTTAAKEVRKEIVKQMKTEVFQTRKNAVIRQLTAALNNLKQIRERLNSRIIKAQQSGRTMTAAKNALVVADGKIAIASQAIAALGNITVTATSTTTATSTATTTETTATTTVTVDLEKPRQAADAAIKAIKDAHKALVDVVKAIAHNMGFKVGGQASTTVATTTTATSTTATTTTATSTTATSTTATTTATSTP